MLLMESGSEASLVQEAARNLQPFLSFIVKQPFLANQGIFWRQIFQANHNIIMRRRE